MGRNDRRSHSSHSAEHCCSTSAQKAQHETNDATVKECPSLSLVERLSFRGLGEAVNDELVHAIGGKHLVEFVYEAGRTRIVEPHDYGIRRDVERLLGFQIGGESQSGASHGWREFDVDQIRHLRVLDRRFAGTRADSAQHHRTWDTLFARVT
jgi:predicted DNA-binding transcriptional regulator YafY